MVVGGKNGLKTCRIYAKDLGAFQEFELGELPRQHTTKCRVTFAHTIAGEDGIPEKLGSEHPDKWSNYVRGVIAMMAKNGHKTEPFDLLLTSTVPSGGGLSSSAAIEVATCCFLEELNGHSISKEEVAKMCQKAEHEYAGVNCGIMDQFISAKGAAGHALMIDCRPPEKEVLVPINDPSMMFVICNTNVSHSLGDGAYNERVAACDAGMKIIAKESAAEGKAGLRDVTLDDIEAKKEALIAAGGDKGDYIYRYCKHVVAEIKRVQDAKAALESNDFEGFGRLMNESHDSLDEMFEVSCDELNKCVEIARSTEGVLGSRMSGGGFGGCTVTLVKATAADALLKAFKEGYAGWRQGSAFKTAPGPGAGAFRYTVAPAAPARKEGSEPSTAGTERSAAAAAATPQ